MMKAKHKWAFMFGSCQIDFWQNLHYLMAVRLMSEREMQRSSQINVKNPLKMHIFRQEGENWRLKKKCQQIKPIGEPQSLDIVFA